MAEGTVMKAKRPESEERPRTIDLEAGRRAFLGAVGLGVVGAALFNPNSVKSAFAQSVTDVDIFNFALNLEYLEAEFYLRASVGQGLATAEVTGTGTLGPVAGGRAVPFATQAIANYANEIARNERSHVNTLRAALGSNAVARPASISTSPSRSRPVPPASPARTTTSTPSRTRPTSSWPPSSSRMSA